MTEEHEILHIDCTDDATLASLEFQDSEIKKKLPIDVKEYDRIRVYTKYITKEYDNEFNLISVEPFFIDVRLSEDIDPEDKLVSEYVLATGAKVQIYEKQGGVGYLYRMMLPEMNIGYYDLQRLYKEVEDFKKEGITDNKIVERWYKHLGIFDHLLLDEKVQEMNINPPGYKTPLRIVHADFDSCNSNIYPSDDFLNYFMTRLRMQSGRPLNKAQPQLDTEIAIGKHRARVAAIIDPFSIYGTGFSLRKHRLKPWTLPLFVQNNTLNTLFSGFISFVTQHGRSFLVAGPRGSGKTALLGSFLLEILPKYRMITIEDTQELPIDTYKKLGYDILPLKVKSALVEEGIEMPFDKGLRTSLRLGDSCLILGEIRSTEAKVLYEAMRVGAMSNVVAGTIHADSPYGVFDRVVNDLGVTRGSFKVTDLIIIVNQIKDPTGIKRIRRVMKVTEVLKEWEDTPVFQDLFVYSPKTDQLEPTPEFLNGKCEMIKTIMNTSKGMDKYEDVLKDIGLRAWAKAQLINLAKDPSFLEARFVVEANNIYSYRFVKDSPLKSEENEEKFKRNLANDLSKFLQEEETDRKKSD